MKTSVYLSYVSTVISLCAYVLYNKEIFRGSAQSNIASWGLWAFITVLNFTSYRSMTKDWIKSLLPTANSFACIVTFFFVFSKGELRSLGAYDVIVMVLGGIAALVWWSKKDSLNSAAFANIILQATVVVGFIPILLAVWQKPSIEVPLCWFMWTVSFFLAIIVVKLRWRGQFQDLVYPVNCFILHLAVGLLAIR